MRRWAPFCGLILWLGVFAPPVAADILVGNLGGSVTSYEQNADGDVAPLTELTGAATQLDSTFGIAVDDTWLYVTDQNSDAIYVFPKNATGDVAPTRTIQGANTNIQRAAGLAVDDNWIYVADENARAIHVYPKGGDGNIAPTRTISGPSTTFVNPFNIALDGTWMYVSNGNRNSVAVFPIGADGDVAPTRSIEGASTGFGRILGIAVDASWIYVSGETVSGIFVFPLNGDGDIAPTRVIQGGATLLNNTYDLEVDSQWIYATEWGFSVGTAINVFPLGADGNVAPTRRISGAATNLDTPVSIALSDVTPVVQPAVTVTKSDALQVDAGGDGLASPGDTLRYTVVLDNSGAGDATNVAWDDTPDAYTTLLVGSVTTSQGTVTSGNGAGNTAVAVDVGTLSAAGSVTIQFDVIIDDPLPNGVTAVANQGSVTGDNFAATFSDDPDTPGADDPTVTAIDVTAPELTLSRNAIDFGAIDTGTSSPAEPVTLSNMGTAQLDITGISALSSPFTLVGGSCGATPIALAPGANCTLEFSFSPTEVGLFDQFVDITSNAPSSPDRVTLQGEGLTVPVGPPPPPPAPMLPVPVNATWAMLLGALLLLTVGAGALRQRERIRPGRDRA